MPILALMGLFFLSGAAVAVPGAASAPQAPIPTYQITLTGYNALPEQTDDTPFETASGAYTNPEVVAARSRDLATELPFGTIIAIEAPANGGKNCGYGAVSSLIGYRIIEDTMNARYKHYIDVLFATEDQFLVKGRTRNAAGLLGVCSDVSIRVVGHVKALGNGKAPKTQKELAALVEGRTRDLAVK